MLEAIVHARSEVLVEMYWFGSDRTGRRFADALIDKARQGVTVRVIYDAIGSFETDRSMFEDLGRAGCEVLEYNPIAPWRARFRVGVVNNRNHRKTLIVDRSVAFTGGVNLGDPWAPKEEGGGGWRDDMVRIEGPAVEEIRATFKATWKQMVEPAQHAPSLPPPPMDVPPQAAGQVRVLANAHSPNKRAIRQAYLKRITEAQRFIYITNSYFVPALAIRRALVDAATRGVDVRVIVPGESDVPAVYYAGRYLYQRLMDAGVKLHEWQGTVLHAKTAVVDATWCTVGSYNLDYRSWRFNLEITAEVEDGAVARAMQQRFEHDLQNAPAVDPATWPHRSVSERMVEWFFYLFRKLL